MDFNKCPKRAKKLVVWNFDDPLNWKSFHQRTKVSDDFQKAWKTKNNVEATRKAWPKAWKTWISWILQASISLKATRKLGSLDFSAKSLENLDNIPRSSESLDLKVVLHCVFPRKLGKRRFQLNDFQESLENIA